MGPDREHEERAAAARDELRRLGREGDAFGTSIPTALSERARRHFAASDAPPHDPVEVWATRLGRALAVAFTLALLVWFALAYL